MPAIGLGVAGFIVGGLGALLGEAAVETEPPLLVEVDVETEPPLLVEVDVEVVLTVDALPLLPDECPPDECPPDEPFLSKISSYGANLLLLLFIKIITNQA